jgi:TetR/AcrR family transcriptional repressor of nem operon
LGTNGFAKFVDIIAAQIEGLPPELTKQRALVAMSTMIGALTVARLVNDPQLSVAILKAARKHVRDLVVK